MAFDMGGRLGTVFVELDLDKTKFEASQRRIVDESKNTAIAVERGFQILKVTSDNVYQAMANQAIRAYQKITSVAKSSAQEQFRAQSAFIAKVNALNIQKVKNPLFETLGVKSQAMIKEQEHAIITSYDAIKKSGQATAQDLINIEKAKNFKLKELNKEMVGHHEMSTAPIIRATLRIYAAYYVLKTAAEAFFRVITSGLKSIDDLKIATVGVAAQITTMQGTTGNIAENYRKNLEYARALVPVLMEVDAHSLANYELLQGMNLAMTGQGVILDVNNQKQIASFTALSNAIALYTAGQNQEKQMGQEIRAIMSGNLGQGALIAKQLNDAIKIQGVYKDGLKELVVEGKKHGDTLERLLPYLAGIVEASSDIQNTWQSVTTSLNTAWGIIQRGMFANLYEDLTTSGKKATEWMKTNADEIVKQLKRIADGLKYAIYVSGIFLATTVAIHYIAIPGWIALNVAMASGSVLLAAQILALNVWSVATQIHVGKAVFAWHGLGFAIKSALGVLGAVAVGYWIGTWLNGFKSIQKAATYTIYAIVDIWAAFFLRMKLDWVILKQIAKSTKALVTSDTIKDVNERSNIERKALIEKYALEKKLRKQNRDDTIKEIEEGIKDLKNKTKIEKPDLPPPPEEESKKIYTSKMNSYEKLYDMEVQYIDHLTKLRVLAGENELTFIFDSLTKKEAALFNAYSLQKNLITNHVTDVKERNAQLESLENEYTQKKKNYGYEREESVIKINNAIRTSTEKMYMDINEFSSVAINNQINLWEMEAAEYIKIAEDKVQAAALAEEWLQAKKDQFNQDNLQNSIAFYSQIIGAEETYRNLKLEWIDREAERLGKLYNDDVAAAQWAQQEKLKLDKELTERTESNWKDLFKTDSGSSATRNRSKEIAENAANRAREAAARESARVAKEAAEKAESIARQKFDLEIELMESIGNKAGAVAAKRKAELDAMDESLRPLQLLIWATEDWKNKMSEMIAEITSDISEQISLSEDAARSARQVADQYKQIIESLDSSARKVKGTGSLDDDKRRLNTIFSIAMTGEQTALKELPSAIDNMLSSSMKTAKSAEDYAKDQSKALLQLAAAREVSVAEMTREESQATSLEAQITLLGEIRDNLNQESPDAALLKNQSALLDGISVSSIKQTLEVINGNDYISKGNDYISKGNQYIREGNDYISKGNQYTVTQTDKIIEGNLMLAEQTAVLHTGNSTQVVIQALTKESTSSLTRIADNNNNQLSRLTDIRSGGYTTVAAINNVASTIVQLGSKIQSNPPRSPSPTTPTDDPFADPPAAEQKYLLSKVETSPEINTPAEYRYYDKYWDIPDYLRQYSQKDWDRGGYNVDIPAIYEPAHGYYAWSDGSKTYYAKGGDFEGGYRVVGEEGPELEYTGPSHIMSNEKSKSLFDDSKIVAALEKLRTEAEKRDEESLIYITRMSRVLDSFDAVGLPPERS